MSRKRPRVEPAADDATPRRRVVRLLAELIVTACHADKARQASAAAPQRTKGGAQ